MKLIKKATPAVITLADKFKIGQEIEVTRNYFDGRTTTAIVDKFTIAKVNKVTIDIIDAKGDTYRLDPKTAKHVAIIK
jgi:flagellar hook assembly protein FlgD